MPRRQTGSAATALVGAAAVAVLVSGAAYASAAHVPPPTGAAAASSPSLQVRATAGAMTGALLPGGAVEGSVFLRNPGPAPVALSALELRPATTTAPSCDPGSLAFALLSAPTPQAPLLVPGRADGQDGAAAVGYTAFLSAQADPACRAALFRSQLVAVDPAGRSMVLAAVSTTAGVLPVPLAPAASGTTATTVDLEWSAPPDLPPGTSWIVERAAPGPGAEWTPACGSDPSPLTGTSCTDRGLVSCTGYTYRVVAVVGRWRATSRPSEQVWTASASG